MYELDSTPGAPVQVKIGGGRISFRERRQIDRGAQVVLFSLDGETLAPLLPLLGRVRSLWVVASGAIDLAPLEEMSALEVLQLSLDRPGLALDLSHLPALRRVGLTSANAWRRAGSAISAPLVDEIGIWSPEESLFRVHPTRASRIRLALVRRLHGLPPLSDPGRVLRLEIQEAPSLDLAGVEEWSALEVLSIEHVRSIAGFGRLRALPQLRELWIGAVSEVDDPAALLDLDLERFHERTTKSEADRIWWLPDLDVLDARGVDVFSPGWRPNRAEFEERWSRRTGRPIPRHFAPR